MRADFRHALRLLRKSPGFTAVAVLSVALGLAANTAVFSFVIDVFFRRLPLADPDSLVLVWTKPADPTREVSTVSADNFGRWRRASRSFAGMSASKGQPSILFARNRPPERARGLAVTEDFFDLFRQKLARGRGFSAADYEAGNDQVIVLTHRFWQSSFGGDPDVVGQTVRLNLAVYTIIGVLAPENAFGGEVMDLYVPHRIAALSSGQAVLPTYLVHARLKPGVGRAQAQAEMDVLAGQLASAFPETNRGHGITVRPIDEWLGFGAEDRRTILAFFTAVICVQLIVCANLANLLLARAVGRRREMAVRAALGANLFHLARPFLAEALLLSGFGGLLGLLLAYWLAAFLAPMMPRQALLVDNVHVSLDFGVAAFALAASALTAVVCGLVPAWQSVRVDLNEVLKENARGGSASSRHRRLGTWLVAGEIALAVVLAVASALTLQTLWRLQRVPLGYVTENVGIINLRVPPEKYADDNSLVNFQDAVLRRAAAIPGVVSAALVSDLSEYGSGRRRSFTIAGQTPRAVADRPTVGVFCSSPDYGAVLGIPLVKGRGFSVGDRMGAPRVAVVSQRFVDRSFAGENPLGRSLAIDLPPTGRAQSDAAATWEIIGVMANVKNGGGRGDESTTVMLPFAQQPSVDPVLVVRTSMRPEAVLRTLRQSLLELDRDLLVIRLTTMAALFDNTMSEERNRAWLLGGFGGLAIFLAGLGVYGVVSYHVSQRTRDIGIRLALGAQPADVRKMILREGAVMAAFGGGIGLLLSLAVGRLMESMLFGVRAIDPWSLLAATVLMSAVTLLGCWIPARRATRVSPTEALRAE